MQQEIAKLCCDANACAGPADSKLLLLATTAAFRASMQPYSLYIAVFPIAQLLLLATGDDDSEAGAFYAAAVSEAGEAYVWRCEPSTESSLKGRMLARVRVEPVAASKGSVAGSMEVIMAAHLEQGSRQGEHAWHCIA